MKKLLLILTMLISATALADNTSFNPNSVALAPRTTDTTPIGTVVIWSNNQAFPDINGNTVWLPCNGQEIPSGIEYDELRTALASSNLPNYNNDQFLQGASSNIGQEVAEQSKILTVDIPAHKHDLTGGVAGGQTIVSGGAGGQGFSYKAPNSGGALYKHKTAGNCDQLEVNEYRYSIVTYGCHYIGFSHTIPTSGLYREGTLISGGSTTAYGTTNGGAIWGTTSASGLSGTTGAAGATTMTIKDTTAPAHTKVMYYIKARD